MNRFSTMDGTTGVVTGAGHGIGRGITVALRDIGSRVCGIEVDSTKAISLKDDGVEVLESDISHGNQAAEAVIDLFGTPPDFIINNVGIMDGRSFIDLPVETVKHVFDANLFGPWEFSRTLARRAIAAKKPMNILFILSLHTSALRMCPDYSSSKAAARMLMKEMAHALGPYGIRVNALSPGAIDTWSDTSPDSPTQRARTNSMIPRGRVGEVSDVVDLALVLLDNELSGYVTGTDLVVDGGLGQHNWLHALYGDPSQERRRMAEGLSYEPEAITTPSESDR